MISSFLKIPYLRLKYKFFPNQAQVFWAQELLNSQGLTAKIGQVLGQGKKTQAVKSTLSFDEVKKLFKKQFDIGIGLTGEVHAASMGQVFIIQIDNNVYASKILHPGIKKKIQKEISNILILGKYFSKSQGFTFDQGIFKNFLHEVFEEETNLKREAHFQKQFIRIFNGNSKFKIPSIIDKYSDDVILSQEFAPSALATDLYEIKNFHIFDFFFEALLNHGYLHGDLNDRNWGVSQDGKIVVYDFGCAQLISERRVNGLKKLLMNRDVVNGFKEFGIRLESTYFKGKEQELRDALFISLLERDILPEWNISEELKSKFDHHIKSLRECTDPWVLLMMRSLFSIIRFYQAKNIAIPLGKIIVPYLNFKESEMSATEIKIEVIEAGKQVVFMTLPMTAIDNLENLMPEKVLAKIESSNVNLKQIADDVKSKGYMPQELFFLNIDKRSYKVWIE